MLGGKQISGRKIPLKSAHQPKHIHSSTSKHLHYPSERFFTISWLFALLTVNRQFLFVNEVTHQNHRPKALENCAPPAAKRLGWAIVAWTHWKYNNWQALLTCVAPAKVANRPLCHLINIASKYRGNVLASFFVRVQRTLFDLENEWVRFRITVKSTGTLWPNGKFEEIC